MAISFSLLIPSYNRPDLILETIDSLLRQVADRFEIVVADDASPRQAEILKVLAPYSDSGRIKVIAHSKNLGWSENRNTLVRAASNDWVILLGDDDRLKYGALQTIAQWIKKFPNADVLGMGYDVIDEKGCRVYTYCSPKPVLYNIGSPGGWKELFYFDAVPMWSHHPFTMCTRRQVALKFPYDRSAGIGDDTLCLFEMLNGGCTFVTINQALFEWRNVFRQAGNYTTLSSDVDRCLNSRALILGTLLTRDNLTPTVSELVRTDTFLQRFLYLDSGKLGELRKCLTVAGHDASRLRERLTEFVGPIVDTRWNKVRRHVRAAAIMGPRHFLQLMKYLLDRRKLSQGPSVLV